MIRPIDDATLDAFGAYLADHLKDNGHGGTPLFQPQSRAVFSSVADKIGQFRAGLATPVGQPGWRRGWVALAIGSRAGADEPHTGAGEPGTDGPIIGHVDLRAHPHPCTGHRAVLGMGVHRDHRGRGVGKALARFAIAWATAEKALEWIDLSFLAGNLPAERLYRSVGFHEIATVEDMFRVDGRSVDDTLLALRLRPSAITP